MSEKGNVRIADHSTIGEKSKGHVMFVGDDEYFKNSEGYLYRASRYNVSLR